MCEPATLLAIGTTVVSGAAQRSQAKFQDKVNKATLGQSQKQTDINQGILQKQQSESQESATREKFRIQRIAKRDQATARVAAGESGVSGTSVEDVLDDFSLQEQLHIEAIGRSDQLKQRSIEANKEGAVVSSDLANLRLRIPTNKPSIAQIALTTAAAGFASHQRANPKS